MYCHTFVLVTDVIDEHLRSLMVIVGVWLSEAIELRWEREMELEWEKDNGTESKVNSYSKILSTWVFVRVYL
jgi:hypothetical protein